MAQPRRTVIFANGSLSEPDYIRSLLRPTDRIIVANGGSRHAWQLGVVPTLLIGDSDSLPSEVRRWLVTQGVPQKRFPTAKDETDLELAIAEADRLGTSSLLLLGLSGGRIDHMLANFALLAQAAVRRLPMSAIVGRQHIYAVWAHCEVEGSVGDLISIVPWGGDAHGVRSEGLRWDLNGERMAFDAARGISNELLGSTATISVVQGLLLVIHQR